MKGNRTFYVDILSLGVTQIYLSSRKIDAVLQWFLPKEIDTYAPLPVFNFGDGLRLTDGHTRAYVAYRMGVKKIPVVIDQRDAVTGKLGQKLYRADAEWAKRYGIHTVADLTNYVVPEAAYDVLWKRRCKRSYELLKQADDTVVNRLNREQEGYYLYGANENMTEFYYEAPNGRLFMQKNDELVPEYA